MSRRSELYMDEKSQENLNLAFKPEAQNINFINRKVPVKTVGIIQEDGNVVEVAFVQSSLAKKPKEEVRPKAASRWFNYQFDSMFAKWHSETGTS